MVGLFLHLFPHSTFITMSDKKAFQLKVNHPLLIDVGVTCGGRERVGQDIVALDELKGWDGTLSLGTCPVYRMTDMSENITFWQSTCPSAKNLMSFALDWVSHICIIALLWFRMVVKKVRLPEMKKCFQRDQQAPGSVDKLLSCSHLEHRTHNYEPKLIACLILSYFFFWKPG